MMLSLTQMMRYVLIEISIPNDSHHMRETTVCQIGFGAQDFARNIT